MKSRSLFWIFLFLAFGGAWMPAVEAALRNYGADMTVNTDVQADFFRRYPDLQDERETVGLAAKALDAEGIETEDIDKAAEILAQRTRALLQKRSPQEWQHKAVTLFPELGVAGSEFNALFLRHFNELKQTSPQFLEEPSWPVLLARRCADDLRPKSPSTRIAGAPKPQAPQPVIPATVAGEPATRPPSKWISALNFCLLLAILVQPARLLWRCRRAFAGSDGPVTLWQSALGPAAWTYLLFALTALVRTFQANADQRFLDRFGITLLVSFIAGAAFAVPAYGLALVSIWWWRQRTPATPAVPTREPAGSVPLPAGGRKA